VAKVLNSTIFIVFSFIFIFPNLSLAFHSQQKSYPKKINQIEKNFAQGELIIKFKRDHLPKVRETEKTGISIIDKLALENNISEIKPVFSSKNKKLSPFYKIKFPKEQDIQELIKHLKSSPSIESVKPNYLAKSQLTVDDPDFGSQWGLTKININSAWDYTTGSSDTVIAIIDSGVDTDHTEMDPTMNGKIWTNSGEDTWSDVNDPTTGNGVDDDLNGYIDDWKGWDFVANDGYAEWGAPCIDRDPADPNKTADNDPNPEPSGINEDACYDAITDTGIDHGTYVAGIAAARTNNGIGIAGVCPECKIMPLRVLDDEGWGTYDQMAEGITYAADHGADVINMSLAGPYTGDVDDLMAIAVNYAYEQGAVIVAAAGNGDIYGVGYDIDPSAYKLSPICNDNFEYTDGGDNQVIGVAATNSSDQKTTFSNYGKKYVDISAPGSNILSLANNDDYTTESGTSASTPFVSGVAGLLKSQNPTWDNKQLRDRTIALIQNINSINPSYSGKLGGRLMANRSLDATERTHGSGSLIKGSGAAIYLLQSGQKRVFNSQAIFLSNYRGWEYASISDSRLNDYPNGPDMFFREGSLVHGSSPTVYQIEYPSGTKRAIASASIFLALGYYWNDIIYTSDSILNYHPTGSQINDASSHVAGALVKTESSYTTYLLEDSSPRLKRPIINAGVFTKYFRWQDTATISDAEMATYTDGSSYRYQDGSILKGESSATLYLIAYGEKRSFATALAYTARGYSWSQYVTVDDAELTNYPDGLSLD